MGFNIESFWAKLTQATQISKTPSQDTKTTDYQKTEYIPNIVKYGIPDDNIIVVEPNIVMYAVPDFPENPDRPTVKYGIPDRPIVAKYAVPDLPPDEPEIPTVKYGIPDRPGKPGGFIGPDKPGGTELPEKPIVEKYAVPDLPPGEPIVETDYGIQIPPEAVQ